jgi:hypothetical protein
MPIYLGHHELLVKFYSDSWLTLSFQGPTESPTSGGCVITISTICVLITCYTTINLRGKL